MTDKKLYIEKDPELPDILRNAKRNHGGQTVPADFFSQFEKKMNAVIDAEVMLEKVDIKTNQTQYKWYKQHSTWLSIAASFALIVVIGISMHVDHVGHNLQETDQPAKIADFDGDFEEFENDTEFFDSVGDSYLANTNDYELYDYYCEI